MWYGFTLRYALSSVLCPSQVSSRGLRGVWAWFCFLRVHVVLFRSAVSGLARLRVPPRRARRSRVRPRLAGASGVPVAVPVERSGPSAERSVVASRGELATRGCRLVASSEQGQVHVLFASCIAGLKSNHHFALARFFVFSITIS